MVKIDRTNKCVALFLGLMLATFIANMFFVYPCKYALEALISTLWCRYLC